MGRKSIDLKNKKFGKLTAISIDHKGNGSRVYWLCLCECGNKRIVSNDHLRCGDVTDCGCTRKHISHWNKHLMSNSRLYRIWDLMKGRCYNSNRREYPNYGGRGIVVCDEWLESKNFIEWALNNGYDDGLTLDRINNNGNYCPENCRWVDRKTQQNNRRNNRIITHNGISKTITEWANDNGLPYYVLKKRLDVLGWSFEEAISKPIKNKKSK